MERNKNINDALTEILDECYETAAFITVLQNYLDDNIENSSEIANACYINNYILDKFSKLIKKIDKSSTEIHLHD